MQQALALRGITVRLEAAPAYPINKNFASTEFDVNLIRPGNAVLRLFTNATEIGDEGNVSYKPTQEVVVYDRRALIELHEGIGQLLAFSSPTTPNCTSETECNNYVAAFIKLMQPDYIGETYARRVANNDLHVVCEGAAKVLTGVLSQHIPLEDLNAWISLRDSE